MAKPTEVLPTWATNAVYVAPGEAWDAQPNKVAPPAGLRAEGYEPNARPATDYDNSWKNAVGAWMVYVDGVLDGSTDIDPISRTIVISPWPFNFATSAGAQEWHRVAGPGLESIVNGSRTDLDLRPFLPAGAIITGLVGMVLPGAVRGVGDRMSLELNETTYDWVPALAAPADALIIAKEDSGAAGPVLEVIDIAAVLPRTYDAAKTLVLTVRAGNTGAAAPDTFYGIQLIFTDPGPRNF